MAGPIDNPEVIADTAVALLDRTEGREGTRPAPSADTTTPTSRLDRARARAAGIARTHPALIAPVQRPMAEARAEYTGGSTSLPQFSKHLLAAVSAAEAVSPPTREIAVAVVSIMQELTAVAETVARNLLVAATTANVDQTIIEEGSRSIDTGVTAVHQGAYAVGAGHFNDAVNDFAPNLKFDMLLFYENVASAFWPESTGIQFTLLDKGEFYADFDFGWARMPQDDQLGMTPTTDQLIASVSKTITATAVLQLLDAKNLNPYTAKIEPWLPDHWDLGPGVDDLTFADLLSQRSGLNDNTPECCPDWADTKEIIEDGVTPLADPDEPGRQAHIYVNANYAVLGVLMAMLNDDAASTISVVGSLSPFGQISDGTYEQLATAYYQWYVIDNVFEPAGIGSASCNPQQNDPTLYYDVDNPDENGTSLSLLGIRCAYGGWHLSTRDLGRFMAHLRYGDLVSDEHRAMMWEGFLGWMDPSYAWVNGTWGVYHDHGGDFGLPGGVDACIMSFPDGQQIALLTNSVNGDYGGYQCSAIANAYDDSWVAV